MTALTKRFLTIQDFFAPESGSARTLFAPGADSPRSFGPSVDEARASARASGSSGR